MKKIYLIFACILILMFCGCAEQTQTVESDKPKVYASFYAMYDFARMIGGDNIELSCMVPSGVEPHDWEPSASDIAKLEKADIFIYSGSNMEHWTESVLPTLSNENLRVICMSDYVSSENGKDPHIWLSPDNLISFIGALKDAYIDADGENRQKYEENYNIYSKKAQELAQKFKETSNEFKMHDIIVSHEAYGYMCDILGINQTAIEGLAGESDPTPAKLAEIIKIIKDKNIKYIFTEPGQSEKVIDTVAAEANVEVLSLSPFEFDEQNRDYFTVMEENLAALKTALD